jgi:hypothetical protein
MVASVYEELNAASPRDLPARHCQILCYFAPHESTEVEVRFEPVPGGTRHRGWDAMPPGHPARHGLFGPAFTSMMGLWWADRLEALRARG